MKQNRTLAVIMALIVIFSFFAPSSATVSTARAEGEDAVVLEVTPVEPTKKAKKAKATPTPKPTKSSKKKKTKATPTPQPDVVEVTAVEVLQILEPEPTKAPPKPVSEIDPPNTSTQESGSSNSSNSSNSSESSGGAIDHSSGSNTAITGDDYIPYVDDVPSIRETAPTEESKVLYAVTFVYCANDGTQTTSIVPTESGAAATAPNVPSEYRIASTGDVYTFTGWDKNFSNVTSDMTVTAQYTKASDHVIKILIMQNGQKTTTPVSEAMPTMTVKHHASLTTYQLPTPPDMIGELKFMGWQTDANALLADVTTDLEIYAKYNVVTTITPAINESYTSYVAKPKETVTIAIPVECISGTSAYRSNWDQNMQQIAEFDSEVPPDMYDQSLYMVMGIEWMRLSIVTTDLSGVPFTTDSITKANRDAKKISIVQRFLEDAAYYNQYGFTDGSINSGFSVFDLTVKSGAKNGTYVLPLKLEWQDGEGIHEPILYNAQVQITGASTGGGGTSNGGGGSVASAATAKPVPVARLYIDDVRTEPANPKAGDEFEIVLRLVNTSKTLYLQNLQLQFSAAEDALVPAGESTAIQYIPKLNADSKMEVRIPVVSQPEISNKLVKVDVQVDFEDKKLSALSMQQSVIVQVEPVQRIKVDELKLPSSSPLVGEEYELSVVVGNLGKITLHNLSAKVVSDNPDLAVGSTFMGGNVDSGQSKTAELAVTPMKAGDFKAKVVVTYENDLGKEFLEEKEFSFTAKEDTMEDYSSYYDESLYSEPEPEPQGVTVQAIMEALPPQIYVALGGLIFVIIVTMCMSARRRRRRAMEDDEVD